MAARHTLEHIGHGLYRMPMVPVTQLDAYMEASLVDRPAGCAQP